jgi:Mycotoxin biosynthesis protein UstYa
MAIDHCVDHIRQAIQCGGDLTPLNLVLYPFNEGKGLILGNPTTHTCRNAQAFRHWLDEREDIL